MKLASRTMYSVQILFKEIGFIQIKCFKTQKIAKKYGISLNQEFKIIKKKVVTFI